MTTTTENPTPIINWLIFGLSIYVALKVAKTALMTVAVVGGAIYLLGHHT